MTDIFKATTLRGGKVHYATRETYEVGGGTHEVTEIMPLCRTGLHARYNTQYREVAASASVDCVRCWEQAPDAPNLADGNGTEDEAVAAPAQAETGTATKTGTTAANGTADGKGFAGFTDPGSITVAAIEAAWRAVQSRHAEVPDVVVVTGAGADYRKNTVLWGHFHADQWNTDGGTRHELLISGESLSKGSRHVLETVLHEAVHALCHERGTKDTSRAGKYHNKRFVSAAEELGMEWPEDGKPHGTRGFSAVQLTDETANDYADTLAALDAGRAAWRDLVVPTADGTDADDEADDKPKRKRSRNTKPKAQCECGPEKAIWASRRVLEALTVHCGDCGGSYRMVDPDDE